MFTNSLLTIFRCHQTTLTRYTDLLIQPRRFRYKKKWATHYKEKTHCDRALEYFDVFYKPLYGKLWPSIRISLLSNHKYCALVNNFSFVENTTKFLERLGCHDIIQRAKTTEPQFHEDSVERSKISDISESIVENTIGSDDSDFEDQNRTNLTAFLPVKKVYSSKQLQKKEELEQSVYMPQNIALKVVPCSISALPEHLKVYCFKRGNTSTFPSPKIHKTGLLDYFLLDAASILPVIALDLQRKDTVLDLCAAPGGKTLAISQTLLIKDIVCNDISYSRLSHLKNMLRFYIGDFENNFSFEFLKDNGCHFNDPVFDKVLVDVPCNTDRHVLLSEDNNLFKPGRIDERISLPEQQRNLLVSGIKSCKPGGSVVYSTCTLSFAQNDGVIQSAYDYLMQNSNIDIVVEDLQPLFSCFRDTFSFYGGTRFGELVLPCLSSNFGPMYICKIKRLS
ncbi:5-methylcytosine rRNA methyltransferase NSUN4 isoform X1 [Octopus bimaculoides]|uniref:NOL1/NOP2/Sun domain family member 4 n=1 Tax=Octopus bimaculoides TaxID=37653 RepID=A0A0L8FSE0_OCTBM|nr:5-methylcytosine rRNA methyltransferase NSUN4 isoform X1 [Octopus bimaculoides]|eukprot:XP_014787362.1 PREDICTED: 5-methylcytosine rRNA methyltransferase NSUN4-like isoform X1 [Octopus bimaculoides]